MRVRDELPPVYERLLPPWFDRDAVVESKATCDACAMCAPEGTPPSAVSEYFSKSTKCCTYSPRLPGFLVGAVLADDTPEMADGRARMRARIASRVVVTPRWVSPTAKYSVLLDASRRSSFGRSEALLCPFFRDDDGGCTIWRHRESVCSSFFCKYDAGADGLAYWRALAGYVGQLEIALTQWAVAEVAPELEPVPRVAGRVSRWELEDRAPDDDEYARWWGPWLGREEELYLACYERVRDMPPERARALVSDEPVARRLTVLSDARDRVQAPRVPERLRKNDQLDARDLEGGAKIVVSYWPYEPSALPGELWELLGEFTAAETSEQVRARLKRTRDVDFPVELVAQLYRLRILVDAAP
jgi:Fe-S-cluster containining protein